MAVSSSSQRTKEKLAESLKHLLAQKGLSRISVSEVIAACGMNRQTFYYHFRSIFDLAAWMFREETANFLEQSDRLLDWEDGMRLFILYVERHPYLRQCAQDDLSRDELCRFFKAGAKGTTRDIVAEFANRQDAPPEFSEFLSDFYLEALTGMTIRWLKNGSDVSPERFISYLRFTLTGNIDRALVEAKSHGAK